MAQIKNYESRNLIGKRQGGAVEEHIIDRAPGIPRNEERIFIGSMECTVHSCQPAGRDRLRVIVRRA